jgi:serine/threonine protein phosphatase PrpC
MDSPPEIKITAFGKTDVGLIREHNEDNFLIADVSGNSRLEDTKETVTISLGPRGALFLVCDGMGGAAAGEVASQMAVESIAETLEGSEPLSRDLFARRLRRAIEEANDRIYAQARDNQNERGMGTTCTAVALVDGTLVVGQIGDSRCYVLRGDRLVQVTKDQSLAWQLMEAGAMTAEEAKGFEHANIILQALGVQERVEVVLSQVELRRGDVVLVSSDGLHGPVSDEEILQILKEEPDVKQASDRLVSRALEREGPDNVTVVLARFDGSGLPEPGPDEVVQFVPYDPGFDHTEPRRGRADLGEKVTVEVTVPKEAIRLTGSHEATSGSEEPTRGSRDLGTHRSEASSVLTFVLLTLVAATTAGAFIKCDRSRALERERQAASAATRRSQAEGEAVTGSAAPAPPSGVPDPAANARSPTP